MCDGIRMIQGYVCLADVTGNHERKRSYELTEWSNRPIYIPSPYVITEVVGMFHRPDIALEVLEYKFGPEFKSKFIQQNTDRAAYT